VIGEIVRNAMPVRPEDKNKDQDDSAFEPTGNLVADEIKRRRWALFPARPAPKRPQDSRPLVAPGALSSNYGATQSCDPSSLDPSKPTLVSVTKLAYSAQAVVILYPIRYIPIHFLILFFTSSDIVRRYDCLKQPKCSSGDEGSQLWFVVIIATDVCIQLVYVIESIVLYRARKRIKRLMDDDEAAKEAQVHGDIAV
ncbi:hypothetical protein BGZ52_007152, partial [Haplosporangium bisporale]